MKKLTILLFPLYFLLAKEFNFIILGDTQFHNKEIFAKSIEKINTLKPVFIVHVGDMIHGHTHNTEILKKEWNIFYNQVKSLKSKFYPTAGNHDMTTTEGQYIYRKIWGNYYYSFNFKNIHFISLNTFTNIDSFYYIDYKQQQWLINDLQNNKDKLIFVSLHPPLYLTNWNYWKEFHELFKKYNVKAVFTGHSHIFNHKIIDSINYYCINTSGNMLYSSNFYSGFFHGFIEIKINNNKIDYVIHSHDKNYFPNDFNEFDRHNILKIIKPYNSILYDNSTNIITIDYKNNYEKTLRFNFHWDYDNSKYNIKPIKVIKNYDTNYITNTTNKLKLILSPYDSVKIFYKIYSKNINSKPPTLRVTTNYLTKNNDTTTLENLYYLLSIKSAYSPKTNVEPIIDGMINQNEWNDANKLTEFYNTDSTLSNIPTKIYIKHDSLYLYLGFYGYEPKPKLLTAKANGTLPLVFGDDDIEFHFYPDNQPKELYRIMINPANTSFISGPNGRFSFPVLSKTYIGKDFWSCEIKVKLLDLGINLPTNMRFNIRRNRLLSYPFNIIEWQKTSNYPPYELYKYGRLYFE